VRTSNFTKCRKKEICKIRRKEKNEGIKGKNNKLKQKTRGRKYKRTKQKQKAEVNKVKNA
jgi:hypothetical protein